MDWLKKNFCHLLIVLAFSVHSQNDQLTIHSCSNCTRSDEIVSSITRLPVSLGSNITLNCTRVCGLQTLRERWKIYSNEEVIPITDPIRRQTLEEETGVTFHFSNESCNGGKTNYSLTISNVTTDIDGWEIECGVQNFMTHDEWYTSHRTKVFLDYSQISTGTRLPVLLGSNVTLNCTRVCGLQTFRDRWKIYSSNETIPITNPQRRLDFERETGVTFHFSNEDYEGCDGEMIEYSLTISNITSKADGWEIECGAQNFITYNEWYTSHKTVLFIDYSQVTSNTRLPVLLGSNVTLNCTRVCGLRKFKDRWKIYQNSNKNPTMITNFNQSLQFENISDIIFYLSNEDYKGCDGEMINYFLTLRNITRSVDGWKIECGAQNSDTQNEWYALHTTELIIGNDFTQISTHMMLEKTVIIGDNVTLSCSRVCGPNLIDIWKLHYPDGEQLCIKDSQHSKLNSKNSTDILLLSNEDYSGCDGDVVKYSLSIVNTTRRVDGLIVECGAQNSATGEEWYATRSAIALKLDNSYRRLFTHSTFNIIVEKGSQTTVNCSRPCDPHTQNSWLLQFENGTSTIVTQYTKEEIENKTGITLTMGSNNPQGVCEHQFILYSLTIGNLSDNADGLIVTCGAHRTDSIDHEEWFADYSAKLILENNTQVEMLRIKNQNLTEKIEGCNHAYKADIVHYQLIVKNYTDEIYHYNQTIKNNTAEISQLKEAISNYTAEINHNLAEMNRYREKIGNLTVEINQYIKMIENNTAEINKTKLEIENKTDLIDKYKSKIEIQTNLLTKYELQIKTIMAENNHLKIENMKKNTSLGVSVPIVVLVIILLMGALVYCAYKYSRNTNPLPNLDTVYGPETVIS